MKRKRFFFEKKNQKTFATKVGGLGSAFSIQKNARGAGSSLRNQ
jgi:hypothetical protein